MPILPVLAGSSAHDVCQTANCHTLAKEIKHDVDFNLDPCQDFYQYSCGKWIPDAVLPQDQSQISIVSELDDKHLDTMHRILEGSFDDLLKNKTDSSMWVDEDVDRANFALIKNYYASCMDQATLNKLGPTPVYASLADILNYSTLTEALLKMIHYSNHAFVRFTVGVDDKHPTINRIWVDIGHYFGPSKDSYTDEKFIEPYTQRMVKLLEAVVGKSAAKTNQHVQDAVNAAHFTLLDNEEIETKVKHFVQVETFLANTSKSAEDAMDPLANYNSVNVDTMEKNYPFLEWRKILRSMVKTDADVPDAVLMTAPSYFEKMAHWLKNTEDIDTILKDFFLVRHVFLRAALLDENITNLYASINDDLFSGVNKLPPLWKRCTEQVSDDFGQLLGRYFVINDFGGEKERHVLLKFLATIHGSWKANLPQLDWLDDKTLQLAIEKLGKIQMQAAYSTHSPDLRSPTSLRDYYKGIDIQPNAFYQNIENINKWSYDYLLSKLTKPVDKNEWDMTPQTVNAYYAPTANQFVVTAGISAPPFYDVDAPDYLNFGALGVVAAHEITHAFDNDGRLYNGDGELTNWWTNDTMEKFVTKTQCFIDQYNKFTETVNQGEVKHVNGKLTLSENLADNGAISVSFKAYQSLAETKPQPRLPGISLSPDQLFFVNTARAWCIKATSASIINQLLTDPHSTSRARVNGMMQNSEDFAKVFNCPASAPMNPQSKCKVW